MVYEERFAGGHAGAEGHAGTELSQIPRRPWCMKETLPKDTLIPVLFYERCRKHSAICNLVSTPL